mmetsp:Transcript_21249/g.45397  ORF Transcript_21249/g.45397 Transcript_21249/m.45397 type:complete len:469 (-) Transcript_21249:201-1607(-)
MAYKKRSPVSISAAGRIDSTRNQIVHVGKELAWKCHKCSRHNHLHKLRCLCGAWKGKRACASGSYPGGRTRRNAFLASLRASTEGCDIVEGVERHGDECLVCGYGGELICCDSCDKVYHGKCLQIDDPGTLPDPWHCPACCPDAPEKMPAKSHVDKEQERSKTNNECEKMPANSPVKKEQEQGKANDNGGGGTPCKKDKSGHNSDDCFICDNGGLLVCCDHCDKSFHMHCHVPPLHSIPQGKWKCCECAASSYSRRFKCGQCDACLRDNCGKCIHCLDMRKFGGAQYRKQVCIHRNCPFKRYAPPATVTPEMKKQVSRTKNEHIEGDNNLAAMSTSAGQIMARHNIGKRKHHPVREEEASTSVLSARRSKRTDTANTVRSRAMAGGRKPTASIELPAIRDDDIDAYSQATVPFPNAGVNDDGDENNTPNDLLMCQMELKRTRAENKRQADEITRLKAAIQALTASLVG